ncbi:MAG: tetrapyrrole methylase [Deltaproteobacteria bacterium]|nr:tetrapyrrole methylase [Deltaproteobacteria bacterium]
MKLLKQILCIITIVLAAVECVSLPQGFAWGRGHFYVIGTGPAGPRMATLQALDTIKRMDYIIASNRQAKLFADYIGNKPILFDPWKGFWDYKGKDYQKLNKEEFARFKIERFEIRDKRVSQIKRILSQGKDVGLLDSGNPCLFGPGHWYVEQFDPNDVVIIPGMGCDAAAMAALKKSVIPAHDTRMVIQTAPFFLMGPRLEEDQVLRDLAKYPKTMIFYMALGQSETLFPALKEVLPHDMPCVVVFWAGYPDRQRIVCGTIADMGQKLANEKDKFMGLLLIGRFLEGKPYEAAMKLHQSRLGQNYDSSNR